MSKSASTHTSVSTGDVGPGAEAGSGSVSAGNIAGRDVHVHQHTGDAAPAHRGDAASAHRGDEPLNDPRLRAVFQELAALETNGGVHLRDYFNLKYRYPELNSEIDAAMLIQLAQAQHKMGERLDRVERTVQRIRRDMLLLFSSPVLAVVALLLILAVRG